MGRQGIEALKCPLTQPTVHFRTEFARWPDQEHCGRLGHSYPVLPEQFG